MGLHLKAIQHPVIQNLIIVAIGLYANRHPHSPWPQTPWRTRYWSSQRNLGLSCTVILWLWVVVYFGSSVEKRTWQYQSVTTATGVWITSRDTRRSWSSLSVGWNPKASETGYQVTWVNLGLDDFKWFTRRCLISSFTDCRFSTSTIPTDA